MQPVLFLNTIIDPTFVELPSIKKRIKVMITAVKLCQLLRRTYIFYVIAPVLCFESHIEFSRPANTERGKHKHFLFRLFIQIKQNNICCLCL